MKENQHDIIYSELFRPITRAARQRLLEKTGENYLLLTRSAHAGLEQWLLRRLAETARPLLNLKFSAFQAVRQPSFLIQSRESEPDENLHQAFISEILENGCSSLFCEFAVFEKLLKTLINFWIESCREFLERLRADWQTLQKTYAPDRTISQITEARGGLSDPHHQGRSVILVVFDSGLKLLYKPRNPDIDSAWFDLLRWFSRNTDFPEFKTLGIISRKNYGWMEYAGYQLFEPGDESLGYYYRAGMLLCLIYVLGGSDFQHENVMVCGKYPVLIDLETLLQPRVRYESDILSPVQRRFSGTALGTHFLPTWETDAKGNPCDVSAMGKLPIPSEHETERFIRGFSKMYRYLAEHRTVFIGNRSPLKGFIRQNIRMIFRDTSLYERILKRSLDPKFLRHEQDRRKFLESCLTRLPVASDALPCILPRCYAEIEMMEDMDIPYFRTDAANKGLYFSSSGCLEDYFAKTAYDRMNSRVRGLNERELAREIAFIRSSFYFRSAFTDEISIQRPKALKKENAEPLTAEKLMETAREIADHIREMAIFSGTGAVSWAIPEDIIASDGRPLWRFQAPDYFLYQGISGIALFLSAMEQVHPGAGYGKLASKALEPLCTRAENDAIPRNAMLGAGSGISSLIYALTRISRFLEKPSLLKTARNICALMTDGLTEADEKFDLLDGSAGAILGLLALYDAAPETEILERAVQCGRHLLAKRSADESGLRSWKTIRGKRISGMAHGTAGIAYALLRLYAVTNQEVFRQAAKEAIAFENTFFSPDNGNWRAFGSHAEAPDFWNSFCHGAPGIGLARAGGLKKLDTPEIRNHIEIAIQTTCDDPWDGPDFVCCGNFGRIEFLLEAAKRLKRKELLRAAHENAARILARKKKEGNFNLFEDFPAPVDNPGFFRGSAGIGYVLLRLAYPDQFPCVLLWE
ncbi:type 2 lanthipeptide synthetase LanM family protein [Desulfonema magnum]|uniref:Lantibiotic biosynthesis protein, type 2 n=1 Tax=Desulfonema magnum TaxID=45655 RepID=A0A975GL30_9BACT|nr:type 2 lanthipeptide synthetase LanM family protein [Desulfonema magnum]QTA85229.1 Putative lantibiotic biosynthesis protein, type 2 [Desulfonema magnum]